MIVPDVNLLVYAYNQQAPGHDAARRWWEAALSRSEPVGMPWTVMLGFVRIMTSRRILAEPMPAPHAVDELRRWLARPHVRIIQPTPSHLDLLGELSAAAGAAGDLTTDIHIAALAIEHDAEVHTNDRDFTRFPGLRHTNPLAG